MDGKDVSWLEWVLAGTHERLQVNFPRLDTLYSHGPLGKSQADKTFKGVLYTNKYKDRKMKTAVKMENLCRVRCLLGGVNFESTVTRLSKNQHYGMYESQI